MMMFMLGLRLDGVVFCSRAQGVWKQDSLGSFGFLSVISDRDYFALRDLASSPVVLFGGVGRAIG